MSIAELLWLVAPPLCWGCADAVRGGGPICRRCRAELRRLDTTPVEVGGVLAWAPLAYDGPARALVGGLKYKGAAGLADSLAAPIAAGAPAGWLKSPGRLVPVPLHPARRRRRGFNQAERLARALARRTGLGVNDCLRRSGSAAPQVGRGRAERLSGATARITLAGPPPPRALLVDDVITTGATLAACAAALRSNGCGQVAGLAYARTLGR